MHSPAVPCVALLSAASHWRLPRHDAVRHRTAAAIEGLPAAHSPESSSVNHAVRPQAMSAATPIDGPAQPTPWLGVACGLIATLIWGVQAVVSRQSVADGLTAADVTILRFSTAALILLPWALWRMRPFPAGALGWRRALILTLLAGAPYSLVLIGGAAFAPALHSSIITPGLIPIFTAGLAFLMFRERAGLARLAGLLLVVIGVAIFSWETLLGAPARAGAWVGDLLFVLTAVMWSSFGLLARRWGANAMEVTVATCLLSLLLLPVFALVMPIRLGHAGFGALALQALYQGVLVGVAALFFYTRAVALLGAARTALFLPLVPVVTALAAAPLLSEWPSSTEIAGMAVVITGMTLAFRSRSAA
jgi:drug/metabolite transporter (DMT)-like permease